MKNLFWSNKFTSEIQFKWQKQKIKQIKNIKKIKTIYKIRLKIIKSDDTEIHEYEFHQYKSPVSINDIDINEIVLSNKFPFGKHDFISLVAKIIKNKPLCIFFREINVCKKYFDKTKCVYVMVKDEIFWWIYENLGKGLRNIRHFFGVDLFYFSAIEPKSAQDNCMLFYQSKKSIASLIRSVFASW